MLLLCRHGWAPARRLLGPAGGAYWLALVLLGALPAAGQTAPGPTVTEIRFEGLDQVSTTYANSVVRVRPGDSVTPTDLDADVARLLACGKFATAAARTDTTPQGVVVVFVVGERERITAIRYVGNQKFKEKKLTEQVPLKTGDPIDVIGARQGADAILLLYRDAGYGQAQVTYDEALLTQSGELVYTIEEGPHVRVRRISYEGNEHYPPAELNKQITTKTYLWILRDGKFDEDTVEADAAAIQTFYRREGYLDARASYRTDLGPTQEELYIVFTIVEGTRYSVESILLSGQTVFAEGELRALMTLVESGPMLQAKLDKDVKAIQDKYGAAGYIYAEVRAERVFSEAPGLVQVRIAVTEGEQYAVGRIVVRGNERTKEKVVVRELDLYPEDVFDIGKARQAEQNLRQTQYFDSVSVTPVGEQPNVRDILVNVEEARKAGDLVFGFGVTSNSGLVGSIMLDIKNFDLFRTPRTFSELFKFKSFYGAGQRLRIEAQPGTEVNRFRIDFTEPYLLDQPTRFDVGLYYFERDRDEYDEQRVGTTISFGRRLKSGPLKNWYGELAFRLESVDISDVGFLSAPDIQDAEGSHYLSSVKASLVRDRTDNRFAPTRGDRLRLSYEQFGLLGGDYTFGKANAEYARHFAVYADELDRKHVLTLKGEVGFVVGDAPVFERYYAGGIGSIRGFQFRTVSPRQGIKNEIIGGDFLALFSAEYSFPLYAEMLRGLFFSDMGTVQPNFSLDDWRISLGTGVRVQIDFFGPVPLEFDLAVPVVKADDDDDQIFSFFVGATF